MASALQPLKEGEPWERAFAYVFLTLVFVVLPVGGVAAGIYFGFITPSITLIAEIAIGWVIEYFLAGVAAAALVFLFSLLVRITGIGFMKGIIGAGARIADNYELPSSQDDDQQ